MSIQPMTSYMWPTHGKLNTILSIFVSIFGDEGPHVTYAISSSQAHPHTPRPFRLLVLGFIPRAETVAMMTQLIRLPESKANQDNKPMIGDPALQCLYLSASCLSLQSSYQALVPGAGTDQHLAKRF